MDEKNKLFKVEFHCHSAASIDSNNYLSRLLRTARQRGLDRLAITDHNTIRNALIAKQMAPDMVIVGEEIRTRQGELIAYFLREGIPSGLEAGQVIQMLKAQHAFISVPHPFDRRRGSWDETELEKILPDLDVLEIFNSRTFDPSGNEKAKSFAQARGLAALVGSDAHSCVELGLATMQLPFFSNAAELRQVIHSGLYETQPFTPLKHALANGSILLEKLMPWNWSRQ